MGRQASKMVGETVGAKVVGAVVVGEMVGAGVGEVVR